MLLSFEEFKKFVPSKPTYALFGYPIGHTMSPELHTLLFEMTNTDAAYIGVAVPPECLKEAIALARQKLCGINLTIPHKKAIIALLDAVDQSARDLHSVNTVHFTEGKAIGYNTDILGFAASLQKDRVSLCGKKVLLIGYGGAAAVMGYHCAQQGAILTITGRSPEKAEILVQQLRQTFSDAKIAYCSKRHIPKDIQIVVQGTPVGMFPKEQLCPLRFLPHKTEYVFDAIYNPPVTSLIRLVHDHRKTLARNGLYMLVMQAVHAQAIWTGQEFDESICDIVAKRTAGRMAVKRLHDKYYKQNIALCGFMGSGKTTAGRKLAKQCGLQFIDTDHYIEEQEGMSVGEIFAQKGETYFRDKETEVLCALAKKSGMVLALGGGAILRPENVDILKSTSLLIHLNTPFYRILKNVGYSNNRPLLEQGDKQAQTRKLYHARKGIYRAVADCSVRSPRLSDLIVCMISAI